MARVTSKLQLTIPKVVADQYGLRPGDEVDLEPSGSFIRMSPPARDRKGLTVGEKVKLFTQLLERHRRPNRPRVAEAIAGRGWKREDLYTRGSTH